MKGGYILLMELSSDGCISIGKQVPINFQKGWYVYIGSAMNGIEQRIKRHYSSIKKMHWHIDYFLESARIKEVFYKGSNKKEECDVVRNFIGSFKDVKGFGCSDCFCTSHLFYGSKQQLLATINKISFLKLRNSLL